jgi:hypothetical protein
MCLANVEYTPEKRVVNKLGEGLGSWAVGTGGFCPLVMGAYRWQAFCEAKPKPIRAETTTLFAVIQYQFHQKATTHP